MISVCFCAEVFVCSGEPISMWQKTSDLAEGAGAEGAGAEDVAMDDASIVCVK